MTMDTHQIGGFCSGTYLYNLGEVHGHYYTNRATFCEHMQKALKVRSGGRYLFCVTNGSQQQVRKTLKELGFKETPFSGTRGVWMHTAMKSEVLKKLDEIVKPKDQDYIGEPGVYLPMTKRDIMKDDYIIDVTNCHFDGVMYHRAFKVTSVRDSTVFCGVPNQTKRKQIALYKARLVRRNNYHFQTSRDLYSLVFGRNKTTGEVMMFPVGVNKVFTKPIRQRRNWGVYITHNRSITNKSIFLNQTEFVFSGDDQLECRKKFVDVVRGMDQRRVLTNDLVRYLRNYMGVIV